MPKINWDKLSFDELKQMQKDVEKAIGDFETRKRQEALAAVQAKAEEMGFSLQDLVGAAKASGAKSVPKYRNQEDPTKTWTGRGSQPQWVKDAIASGGKLEDLLIAK